MTPNCIIFDIDGTLADLRHRLHWIKGSHKNYEAFYGDMVGDMPIEPVITLAEQLGLYQDNYEIVLVSGRPSNYRKETEDWLDGNNVPFVRLYMRKAGDYRPDDVVKREILAKMRADGYEPLLVIDDRPRVVEMWRSEGVFCLQCPWHEDEAEKYDAPNTALSLMVGPSGAGKSTYIASYKEDFPAAVLSSDDMRHDISGLPVSLAYDPSINDRVFASIRELVKTRLKLGLHSVIDATNLHRRDRLAFVNLIPKTSIVEYIVIDRPLEDKLRDRGWRSEELIQRHHNSFQSGLKHILAGDDQPNVRVFDLRE